MAHGVFDDRQTVRRGFCKIITIALLAVFCAALLLSVANDMYAFFKPQGAVTLTVNEPCTLPEFSYLLEENGILFNPHVFSLYVHAKDKAALVESFTGELALDSAMSYREIVLCLAEHAKPSQDFFEETE